MVQRLEHVLSNLVGWVRLDLKNGACDLSSFMLSADGRVQRNNSRAVLSWTLPPPVQHSLRK